MAEEKLAGDITAGLIKAVRLDRVNKVVERVTGRPCGGCGHRKEKLNALHRKLREAKARRDARNADAVNANDTK